MFFSTHITVIIAAFTLSVAGSKPSSKPEDYNALEYSGIIMETTSSADYVPFSSKEKRIRSTTKNLNSSYLGH